ncbi:MAG: hypothetical protein E7092_09325 [Bacteroidales bacterium]|nr:hypothetical protein [Bacteroidales bacterium]
MGDVWDELYEGAELALVREKDNKHDKYAAAAYNFKRAMKALLLLMQKIREILITDRISLKMNF